MSNLQIPVTEQPPTSDRGPGTPGADDFPTSLLLDGVANADPPFPVIINFKLEGMERSVPLSYASPIDAPLRQDLVTVRFNDFGRIRRVSGTVAELVREFYQAGTVPGVTKSGHILQITLTGVTEQAP